MRERSWNPSALTLRRGSRFPTMWPAWVVGFLDLGYLPLESRFPRITASLRGKAPEESSIFPTLTRFVEDSSGVHRHVSYTRNEESAGDNGRKRARACWLSGGPEEVDLETLHRVHTEGYGSAIGDYVDYARSVYRSNFSSLGIYQREGQGKGDYYHDAPQSSRTRSYRRGR